MKRLLTVLLLTALSGAPVAADVQAADDWTKNTRFESGHEVTDDYVRQVIGRMQDLEELLLLGSNVGDQSAATFGTLKHLTVLQLPNTSITSAGLQSLRGLAQLYNLNLHQTKIDDEGLVVLAEFPELRYLSLANNNITDRGLKHLVRCPKLRSLDVSGTAITDEGLATLAEMKNLISVDVNQTKITDAGLAQLAKLPELRDRSFMGCDVGDEAFRAILTVASVRSIHAGLRTTDASLRLAGEKNQLTELILFSTHVTDTGVAQLAGATKLRKLWLVSQQLSTDCLIPLKPLVQLWDLRLTGTRRGVQGFAGLAVFPMLTHLTVSAAEFTDADIEHILGMKRLMYLNCQDTKITDRGLCRAMQNRSISQIIADGTNTSESVRHQAIFPPNAAIRQSSRF